MKKTEVRLVVEIEKHLRNMFKAKSAEQGKTIKQNIIQWIREYLKKGG